MEETILLLKNLYIETTETIVKDDKLWEDKAAVIGKLVKLRDIFNAFDEIREQDVELFESGRENQGVCESMLNLASVLLDLVRDNVKKDSMKREDVKHYLFNIQDMLDYL